MALDSDEDHEEIEKKKVKETEDPTQVYSKRIVRRQIIGSY